MTDKTNAAIETLAGNLHVWPWLDDVQGARDYIIERMEVLQRRIDVNLASLHNHSLEDQSFVKEWLREDQNELKRIYNNEGLWEENG